MLKAPLIDPDDVENFNRSILEKEAFSFLLFLLQAKQQKRLRRKHKDSIKI